MKQFLHPAALDALAFVFGAIWGSFANVCIHRLPRGQSIVRPGSRCPACGKSVRWYDNLPLVSFVILKAKCRDCGAAISPRYLVVELLCAFISLALMKRFGLSAQYGIYFILSISLVIVVFIDIGHWLIPNVISLPGVVVGLLSSLVNPHVTLVQSALGAAAGFAFFFLFGVLFHALTGKEGLGGGDMKLLAMLGAFLGIWSVPFIILFSSTQAVVFWLLARPFGGASRYAGKPAQEEGEEFKPGPRHMPFGPFLSLAAIEFVFFGHELLAWYFKRGAP